MEVLDARYTRWNIILRSISIILITRIYVPGNKPKPLPEGRLYQASVSPNVTFYLVLYIIRRGESRVVFPCYCMIRTKKAANFTWPQLRRSTALPRLVPPIARMRWAMLIFHHAQSERAAAAWTTFAIRLVGSSLTRLAGRASDG